jgi:hypothetical protein
MSDDSTAVALAPQPQYGLALRSLDDYLGFAKIAIESGLSLGHKNPSSVVIAVQFGAELGLSPMASLRNVHVFAGKPLPSADLLVAVALSHPDCIFFRKLSETATEATWETHRRGDPAPTRYSFSLDDAKRAGLTGKDNWKNYTGRMLSARAKAFLARDVYPDRLAGILSVEEAQDIDEPITATAEVIDIRRKADADAIISEPEWKRLCALAKANGHLEHVVPWLQKRYGVEASGQVKRGDYDAIMARLADKSELGSHPEDFNEPEPIETTATETGTGAA